MATYTLSQLAQQVGGEIRGDGTCVIEGVATLHNAGPRQISFLSNKRYKKFLESTGAGAVVLKQADLEQCTVNALVVADPYVAYARIAQLLYPVVGGDAGVHASAVVADDCIIGEGACIGANAVIGTGVRIGERAYIGPGCVLEADCAVGADSRLVANITLCRGSQVGARVLMHPGVVIGADGFGIANDKGQWIKVPQVGAVQIGDDVEIGANTTIDRGAIEDTIIEEGVKLDNLIQIGHNVHIGKHTAIAACTAIAGSARIGAYCAIGGCVGIVGHLEIADRVQITGMSMVTRAITEPGVYSSGTPLERNEDWHKNFVRFKQLDEMVRRIKKLEQTVNKD